MKRLTLYLILFTAFSSTAILSGQGHTQPFLPFVDELPIPPRIQISGQGPNSIDITLSQFKAQIHRDLPDIDVWGYNGSSPGPTIEVEEGHALTVHWKNNLPTKHLLVAPAGMMMDPTLPDVRAVTHLHGAKVSEPDPMDKKNNNDGWPDAWNVAGEEQQADYPNDQSARMLWYHDHAMGETGRNVAAGLAGAYIIRDPLERSLNLPSGDFEIPLIIQSKGINIDGSLYYSRDISSEYYGNAVFVNGKLYPYLNVEPRKYRFRILNASNARTFGLRLFEAPGFTTPGPAFYQIGSDGGFLEKPAVLNDPEDPGALLLTLAPAERADVIIDFSTSAGKSFLLRNLALPDGGDHELPLPQVMMFKVKAAVSQPDTSVIPKFMRTITRMKPSDATTTRQIIFSQTIMPNGTPMLQLNRKSWTDPITEKPVLGTTEIWELIDTLPDSHPFHIHLVDFQILDRTPFDIDAYAKSGKINYIGAAESPDPNEMGWKDVVRVYPAMVTRIILKFAPFTGFYVYHCHILEHEDMDMMRPFEVVAPKEAR